MRKNKKNIKVFAATGMCLFSLVAVFAATIAWFTMNNSVGASGMTIKVKTPGVSFSSIEVHRCISNQCTDSQLVFYETGTPISDGTPESLLAMEEYGDFVNSDPILILFNAEGSLSLKVTVSTSTTKFGSAVTNSNKDKYPLSNAINFKSSTNISLSNGKYIATSLSNASAFVTSIPNAGSTSNLTQNIVVFSSNTAVTQIGIIVDYYSDAVNFIKTNLLDENINRIVFACDWSMVVEEL